MAYGYGYGNRNWKPRPVYRSTGPKAMFARFAGTCVKCSKGITVGASILYESGKAWHSTTDGCALAAPVPAPVPAAPVNLDGKPIMDFLLGAKNNGLKFPKARFLAPGGGELLLYLAGPTASIPGALNVKIGDDWVGRITPTGEVHGKLKRNTELMALLTTIASDPATAAKAYGKLTANCSFCGKGLTDDGSVEVGYGPVCAKKWNLPHKYAGHRDLAEIPVSAVA